LSGLAPPASTVLRIPLRGTRLRRAVDPGDLCQPSGPDGEGQVRGQARNARGESLARLLRKVDYTATDRRTRILWRRCKVHCAMADESIENAALTRPSRRQSATISVSWSGLAFAAGALALASTSSLAIVATIVKADALSTIALALAILSFIIQIGLFIAQSWTSGQQVLHSEELNSDTRAILAEVRENARGTNQMIF
jgi:hypothetical protein